ncbi:MAG TPA: type II secretion system protein GspG [Blastocatellia bacterium]|nr:type II secretion system protein GspG [Blastocatellia bacterium]
MDEESSKQCEQCGARLAPGLRYCVSCYRAVPKTDVQPSHTGSAGAVTGTRRSDPTVIFLPEQREAILKRRSHRKKTLLISVAAVIIIAASLAVWHAAIRETPEARHARARERMAAHELATLAAGLEHFRADVGRYPTEREGVIGLRQKPVPSTEDDAVGLSYWSGPYIEVAIEVDPWGNDYVYRVTSDGEGFEIYSTGPGGEESGDVHLKVTSQGKSSSF